MSIIQPGGHFNRRYTKQDSQGNKQIKLSLEDFVDFQLTEYEEEDLQNAFLEWLKDDSYFHKYDKWDIVKDNQILFRVFRYEKEHPSGLMSPTGNPIIQLKILPFGKIIKSTSPHFESGDIIALPDGIDEIQTTHAWLEWKKIIENERPIPDLPEPQKYVGTIANWREESKFVVDKFHPNMDDEYTFVRNSFEFSIKYKP